MKILAIVLAVSLLTGLLSKKVSHIMRARKLESAQGLERANLLIEDYVVSAGGAFRPLDEKNDLAFGAYGFRYDPVDQTLVGRVYVNGVLIEDAPSTELSNYRKMVLVLNDPAVGGMYENGGGTWILDEEKEAYFLTKKFNLSDLNPAKLKSEMDSLIEVSSVWTVKWLGEVAMIMHGRQKAPKVRQTVKQWRAKSP